MTSYQVRDGQFGEPIFHPFRGPVPVVQINKERRIFEQRGNLHHRTPGTQPEVYGCIAQPSGSY